MFIKKSLISLAVASLLVGCGSSSDNTENSVEKRAYNSIICKNEKTNTSICFTQNDHDEDAVSSSSKGNTAVIASRYHNSLTLVNLTNNDIFHSDFARVEGKRHSVDASSGASEHEMTKVELSSNEKDVYTLILASSTTLSPEDKKWGLFKTSIVNGKINDYDNSSTKRLADKNISDFTLSYDGSKLAAYNDDYNSIIFYDKDLKELNNFDLDSKIYSSMVISSDNKYLLVSLSDSSQNKIEKYKIEDGSFISSANLDYKADLVLNNETNRVLSYEKTKDSLIKSFNIDNLSSKTIEVDVQVRDLKINDNKLYLLSNSSNEILSYDLSVEKKIIDYSLKTSKTSKIFLVSDKKVLADLSEQGTIEIFDIKSKRAIPYTIEEDLNLLTLDILNHGMPASVVTFDLKLNKSALRGSGKNILWTSTTNNVVLTGSEIGKITRPAIYDEDKEITLTANIGEQSKDFDLVIRKKEKELKHGHKYTLGTINGGGYIYYFAINKSSAISYIRDKSGKFSGYKTFKIANDKLVVTEKGVNITADGKASSDSEYFAGKRFDGLYASSKSIGIVMNDNTVIFSLKTPRLPEGTKTNAALLVYDLDMSKSTTKYSKTIVLPGNETNILFSIKNGNYLAVLSESKLNKDETIKNILVYDLRNFKNPTLIKTVKNVSANEIAINDDASLVYALDKTSIKQYDVNTSTKTKKEITITGANAIAANGANLFVGDGNGDLYIYSNNLTLETKFVTGFGVYGGVTSGEGHSFGRVEDIQVIDKNLFMHNKYRGLVKIDISDIHKPVIKAAYKNDTYRRGLVSEDGKQAISFYWEGASKNDVGYINLEQ